MSIIPKGYFVHKGKLYRHGGSGSGDHGHAGRPGKVGGSSNDGRGGNIPREVISDLSDKKIEIAYILDGDGNILSRQEGDVGSVDITAPKKGSHIVHNHPDGTESASIADIKYLGASNNVDSITVVVGNSFITYSLSGDRKELWKKAKGMAGEINIKMTDGYLEGFITKENKNKYLVKYTEESLNELINDGLLKMSKG